MSKLTPDQLRSLRHWSVYGQPGEATPEKATKSTRKTIPMLTPITSTWSQAVPSSEIPRILHGFTPRAMEDKWFVYAEGPDEDGSIIVHMSRSWTGHKMIEAKLKVPLVDGKIVPEDGEFVELIWESHKDRHAGQTEEGAKQVTQEVLKWCMGVQLP